MESSIIKLILLVGAVLVLSTLAYVMKRPVDWARPLTFLMLALAAISLHYLLVEFSINTQNTLSLLNGVILLMTAAAGAAALTPGKCLNGLRILALVVTYPVVFYLLALQFSGSGYDVADNFIGFTENSNTMGGYLALFMFPVVAQSYLAAPSGRARLAPGLMAAAILFLIYLTASRASLLAIFSGLAFVALCSNSVPRKYRFWIIAGVLVSPFFMLSFFQKNEDLGLLSTRALLYQLRFEAIAESPWFGWGLSADVNNTYDGTNIFPAQEKGNTILQLMEEFGVIIGTFFTISITVAIVTVGRRLAKIRHLIWIPMFLVAAWVHSMFETWMFNFQSMLAIFFWLTFMLATFHAETLKMPPGQPRKLLATARTERM